MGFFDFLKPSGDTIKGVMEGAGAVAKGVGKASTRIREAITGDVPSDVKLKLEDIARELEEKKLELDEQIVSTTNQINLEYAKKSGWWYSGWRPAVAWIGVIALLEKYILFPNINLVLGLFGISTYLNIDVSAIYPLMIGLLGLGTLRTAEKKNKIQNIH